MFCCDSEKDAGWGRQGCFPGWVCAAPRPSASDPAWSTGLREREVALRGPGRGPGPGRRHPWPTPACLAPARPRGLSTLGSGSSSPGLRYPGAHPACPLWGWAGREGRLWPDGAGSTAWEQAWASRPHGPPGIRRDWLPLPRRTLTSASLGKSRLRVGWACSGHTASWPERSRHSRSRPRPGLPPGAPSGQGEPARGRGVLSCSKPCWPGSGGPPGFAGVPSSPAVRTQPWRVL